MLAIAGAILINAACVLAAAAKDSADIYLGQRLFAMFGVALIVSDLYPRFVGYIRRARAEADAKAKANAESGAGANDEA
jgi:hypothetical protein